jgi:hypothetical protein
MWWLDIDQHGHPTWVREAGAVSSSRSYPNTSAGRRHGSVPTNDIVPEGNDMWLWVSDVIVPALEGPGNPFANGDGSCH